jgi:hypothetical protein
MGNNSKGLKALALIFVACAQLGWSQSLPLLYQSPRSLGMGGVCVAISEHEQALFTNPAALGLRESKGYSLITPLWAESRDFDTLNSTVGALSDADTATSRQHNMSQLMSSMGKTGFRQRSNAMYYAGEGGFGLSAYYMDTESYFVENPVNPVVGSHVNKDFVFSASIARSLTDDPQLFKDKTNSWLGASLKVATRKRGVTSYYARDFSALNPSLLKETDSSGTALDLDFGGLWQLNNPLRPTIGFFVGNLFASRFSADAGRLERQFGVGASVKPLTGDYERNDRITLAAEYFDDGGRGSFFTRLRLGGELKVAKGAHLSAGLRSGYPTFGVSFDWRDVRLQFAQYSEELGRRPGDSEDRRYIIGGALEF